MAVNHSRIYGSLASLSQVVGVFVFTYLSPIIGLAISILSDILWILEGLAADAFALDSSLTKTKAKITTLKLEFNNFWQNLHLALAGRKSTKETSTLFASTFAIIGGILMMTALFVASGPLGWAIAGCGILSGVFWYMSARSDEHKNSTASENMNKLAAGFQIVCGLCLAASLGLALVGTGPAIAGGMSILGALALSTGIASAIAWMFSYFFIPEKTPVNSTPIIKKEPNTNTENLFKPHSTALIQYRQNIEYKVSFVDPTVYASSVAQSQKPPVIYKLTDPRYNTVKSVYTEESSTTTSKQIEIAKACIISAQKLCGESSVYIDGNDVSLVKAAIKVCQHSGISFTVAKNPIGREAIKQASTTQTSDEYLLHPKTNKQSLSSSYTGHSMKQRLTY